jgi:hypothetical protein
LILGCRYEKELMHPIQNLLNGELARALLIQVYTLSSILLVYESIILHVFCYITGSEAETGY